AEVISGPRSFRNQAALLLGARRETGFCFRGQGAARGVRNRSQHEPGGARQIPYVSLGARSADDVRGNPQTPGRPLRALAGRRVQDRTVLGLDVSTGGTSLRTKGSGSGGRDSRAVLWVGRATDGERCSDWSVSECGDGFIEHSYGHGGGHGAKAAGADLYDHVSEKYRVGEATIDDPGVPQRLARKLGCEHHEIVVEPDVVGLLPGLTWHMDELTADPAIITAYLVCREARKQATVLLSGVGGDEIFAGYRKHAAHAWAEEYRRAPGFARSAAERTLLRLPSMRGTRMKGSVRLAKKMARS